MMLSCTEYDRVAPATKLLLAKISAERDAIGELFASFLLQSRFHSQVSQVHPLRHVIYIICTGRDGKPTTASGKNAIFFRFEL